MANELSEPFERMLERLFPPSRTRAIDAGGGWSDWFYRALVLLVARAATGL